MQNEEIETLKAKVAHLKRRLKAAERFLSDLPQFKNYRVPNPEEEKEQVDEAIKVIAQYDRVSAGLLQRKLSIGYNKAVIILDILEEKGLIGPANGSKPREVKI